MTKVFSFFCRSVYFHKQWRVLSRTVSVSAIYQNKTLHSSKINDIKKEFLEEKKRSYENTFGNIESFERTFERIKDDPEDILEYQRAKEAKGKSTGQYLKEIKSLLENNEYKRAIKVLEIDMVNDKIPLNRLIYKILINYNAKLGNLEEAYRLFIAYKSRQGLVTGAFYSSMFNACANCKNSFLAIEKANAVRECMNRNNFHSVNISNYNAMLKAYGRHGDIPSCMKIMDEVLEKRDRVRNDTYSFLFQACISDKNSGLRYALLVWRKMIQNRIKPGIFSFNLMLRCVRDCSLGDAVLIPDLIEQIMKESKFFYKRKIKFQMINNEKKRIVLKVPTDGSSLTASEENKLLLSQEEATENFIDSNKTEINKLPNFNAEEKKENYDKLQLENLQTENSVNNLGLKENKSDNFCNLVDSHLNSDSSSDKMKISFSSNEFSHPNFLAINPTYGSVIKFGIMIQPYDRFLLMGGVKGFLKTMAEFGVEPNVKTFTLMLDVIPPTFEAEEELISLIKTYKIQLDTGFFNVLVKRRIYRNENIFIKECLKEMHILNLKPDLITFGILANGCRTYESGMELLESLHTHCYRANSEILSALLKRADLARDMKYVHAILQTAKEDETHLSSKFLATLNKIVKKEQRFRRLERIDLKNTSDENE